MNDERKIKKLKKKMRKLKLKLEMCDEERMCYKIDLNRIVPELHKKIDKLKTDRDLWKEKYKSVVSVFKRKVQ